MSTRVWAITFTEQGSEESILVERDETGSFVHLVFADAAYGQAVGKFNEYRDERLSFHSVAALGEFGPDAHAHLDAFDGDDHVSLRPYDVIGGQ
jgi:hypothetical protein